MEPRDRIYNTNLMILTNYLSGRLKIIHGDSSLIPGFSGEIYSEKG